MFTFSYVSWQAAIARGSYMPEDRLVDTLLSHERVGQLVVVDCARSLPLKLVRGLLTRASVPFPSDERRHHLSPVRLRRSDPTSTTGLTRTFRAYGRAMRRAAERLGLQDPVVITAHPLVAGFSDLSWARAVTYYAIDDWLRHPSYSRWWAGYEESYERIRERGSRVAAVSEVLLERLAPAGESACVPNGLDVSEWTGEPTPPSWAANVSRPLLLYVGSLDARIDVGGLLEVAHALPHATIAFVGPLQAPRHLAPLTEAPNVVIKPFADRRTVTSLIRIADVGLVSHLRTPLTEAMSPLKLYEYLAGGLPVVASDLEPVRDIDPRVVLVPEGDDLVAGIRSALALGRASEAQRTKFVAANSWQARHDCLLRLALA
jgi:glycosyltransferase involved in cell wall biosynthesis